jgi:sugar lactone lactonase YvrE
MASMPPSPELVLDAKALLGEGAVWDDQKALLYWVDIEGHDVHIYDPKTKRDRKCPLGEQVGTVVPWRDDKVAVALRRDFAELDIETGMIRRLGQPEGEHPNTRFNDGKADPAGRFWCGTMGSDSKGPVGKLYSLEKDGSIISHVDKIGCSNGLVWSLDSKIFYYIDTPTREVSAFDYDLSAGIIKNRRAAIQVPESEGWPDGMTIDAEGKLWICHWDGWRVNRWDPLSGKLLQTIKLPAARVTSCAFGGANLDVLYVTTARVGLKDEVLKSQPHAGGLFKIENLGVRGLPAFRYSGRSSKGPFGETAVYS